jgi:hypothetical protein
MKGTDTSLRSTSESGEWDRPRFALVAIETLQTNAGLVNDAKLNSRQNELLFGLLLVFVASILLLDRLDILALGGVWRLWPVSLIVAGVVELFRWKEQSSS